MADTGAVLIALKLFGTKLAANRFDDVIPRFLPLLPVVLLLLLLLLLISILWLLLLLLLLLLRLLLWLLLLLLPPLLVVVLTSSLIKLCFPFQGFAIVKLHWAHAATAETWRRR